MLGVGVRVGAGTGAGAESGLPVLRSSAGCPPVLHEPGQPHTAGGPLTPLSVAQHHSFWVGDVVRVIGDLDTVKRLQAGHGEWTDDMAPVSPLAAPAARAAAPHTCSLL